jgi:alkylation response protein AidB-like acyl-CoA dehydrogenase
MDATNDDTRLPADFDAQTIVRDAKAIQPELRRHKDRIEAEQRFPSALVEQLREAGFYRMVVPKSLGGLAVDPITYTRVVENLAEGLGSVGWNLANNTIVQLVMLGLPDDGIAEIYAGGKGTTGAGTAVQGGGMAVPVPGGYRVSGRWSFGSGSPEAEWMLGSFQVLDDGVPRKREDGGIFWRGVFRKDETVTVPGSWDVAGLRGTGSFDWTVDDVFLPERRSMIHAGVPLDNQWAKWPGTTFQVPSQCWIGPHHSSVITGIARAGIEALIELAVEKVPRGRASTARVCESPQVQEAVGRADAILSAGRAHRTAMIAELWNTHARGEEITLHQKARCRLASTFSADCARDAMNLVYRQGGSTSFKRESRLAECWRDLQVVGQTVTIAPEWYPIGGRVLLGMDPGSRLR